MRDIKSYYTKSGLEILASVYPGPCLTRGGYFKQEVVILKLGKVKLKKTAL